MAIFKSWQPSENINELTSRLEQFCAISHDHESLTIEDCERAEQDAHDLQRVAFEQQSDTMFGSVRFAQYARRHTRENELASRAVRHAASVRSAIRNRERYERDRAENERKAFDRAIESIADAVDAITSLESSPVTVEDVTPRSADAFSRIHDNAIGQERQRVQNLLARWQKQLQTIDHQHAAVSQLRKCDGARVATEGLDVMETNAKRHIDACKAELRLIDEELQARAGRRRQEQEAAALMRDPVAFAAKVREDVLQELAAAN